MNPNISSTKAVDLGYATIGDTLNYTVVIKNNGDTSATSVNLTDLIPQGANFVTNSIFVNTINKPGIDPALGIDLATIAIGNTTTVTLQALVVNYPVVNPLLNIGQVDYQYNESATSIPNIITTSTDTNTAVTTINTPIITLTKSSNQAFVGVGTTITYTVSITNTGNVTASNVTFLDTIPTGTTFVPNSVTIFGTSIPGASPAPPGGLFFGALPAGSGSVFTFQVVVVSIPPSRSIINFCDASYVYTTHPTIVNGESGRTTSNVVITSSPGANLVGATKSVDKNYAKCGDILTYTINLPNNGTTTASNVIIHDTVPNGTTFILGSIAVNGTTIGGNPSSIPVGAIAPGAVSTIIFKTQITC
ncbi:DUF11 domain-containing protein [Romboutsia sp.]|uniref:DUF11 domain-containing protein n=1 Tax=Romboutsia sp. TaxID=1965302 RepID=UPI003F2AC1A6